jgi:Ca2+-binding EF-hand superfamily protein
MKCFNGFCQDGVVQSETVNEILQMMGLRVKKEALDAIIAEVDEDGKKYNLKQTDRKKE